MEILPNLISDNGVIPKLSLEKSFRPQGNLRQPIPVFKISWFLDDCLNEKEREREREGGGDGYNEYVWHEPVTSEQIIRKVLLQKWVSKMFK